MKDRELANYYSTFFATTKKSLFLVLKLLPDSRVLLVVKGKTLRETVNLPQQPINLPIPDKKGPPNSYLNTQINQSFSYLFGISHKQ